MPPRSQRRQPKEDEPRVIRTPVWKRSVSVKRPDRRRTSTQSTKQEKRLVGLKIGASQLAAARVTNNGSPELLQIARTELRSGIVVGGELRDVDALAVALKDFFEVNKLPTRGVRLGIANNRIGVRTIDVQGVNDPAPARQRGAVPRPGGAADPDRRGRPRLPGAVGEPRR